MRKGKTAKNAFAGRESLLFHPLFHDIAHIEIIKKLFLKGSEFCVPRLSPKPAVP